MKLPSHSAALFFTLLTAAVVCISGCASTGIERSERTTTTMQTMDNDIRLVGEQLDATGASLDDLTRPGQQDIRKSFDAYTKNVSKMESLEKQFTKHAEQMKARGKEYFEEWKQEGNQYSNPQIRELSEQRRAELGEIYGTIAQNSIGVKEAIRAYVTDIKEIQKFLSNDLTAKGIEAIAPLSQKVVRDGENLKYATRDVQTAISKARAEMAQSGM